MRWSDIVNDVTCPQCLLELAEAEVEKNRRAGWTKADFADALKQLLEGTHAE